MKPFDHLFCSHIAKQNPDEAKALLQVLQETLIIENALEVGVCLGGTLRLWASLVKAGGHLVGVDPLYIFKDPSLHSVVMKFQKELALNANPDIEVDIFKATSDSQEIWTLHEWDFVFIDGHHSFPQPQKDLWNAAHNVRIPSVIGIHDTSYEKDVQTMWQKIPDRLKCLDYRSPKTQKTWFGPGIGAIALYTEDERQYLLQSIRDEWQIKHSTQNSL